MDEYYIYAALIGYFLGSIPFGLMIARLGGQGDIRSIGSGNIGTTNVLRTGRKDLAALTLLFDGGKAAVSYFIVWFLGWGEIASLIAAAMALIGHCFPIWLKFKGGKGVATFMGAMLAAAWPVGLAACAIWLAIAFIFKMSSLAALYAAGIAPVVALYLGHFNVALMAAVLAIIIYIRHKDNIKRIIRGEESKIGQGK